MRERLLFRLRLRLPAAASAGPAADELLLPGTPAGRAVLDAAACGRAPAMLSSGSDRTCSEPEGAAASEASSAACHDCDLAAKASRTFFRLR